jgi:hypothetical protein
LPGKIGRDVPSSKYSASRVVGGVEDQSALCGSEELDTSIGFAISSTMTGFAALVVVARAETGCCRVKAK